MQRGIRSVLYRSVPMQRGARFLIWGYRSMIQHGLNEGVKNIYKTIVILHIFKVKCTPGAATKAPNVIKITLWELQKLQTL